MSDQQQSVAVLPGEMSGGVPMAMLHAPADSPSRRSRPSASRRTRRSQPDDSCQPPEDLIRGTLRSLVRTVEGEIVPRLLLASRAPAQSSGNGPAAISANDVDELAHQSLRLETSALYAYLEAHLQRGVSASAVCLELLAPTARRLGEMWETDECDFMDVTLGLGRLHQLLHRVSQLSPGPDRFDSRGHGRCVLLATVPGELHCFGVMVVAQQFRQQGWGVWTEFPESIADLETMIRKRSFAIVGLSVAIRAALDLLPETIRAIRRSSRNRAAGVLVGGLLVSSHREQMLRAGADALVEDGGHAPDRAEAVCALLAGEA
jgi:methanogenic corrinoid protein MtbC1